MATQRQMKDGLGKDAVRRLACNLLTAAPGFPKQQFEKDALEGLQALELKARVNHLINVMHCHLPQDFRKTVAILTSLMHHWDDGNENDVWRSFAAWPVIDYIGKHGLEHPAQSLDALKKLTPLFTAEFAIRPFIVHHFDLTWKRLEQWCNNRDEHVRRLVSEGTRPRLPWGTQLTGLVKNPRPVLPLLENLKDDKSEYVRRSVANNLNDISKDHPQLVIRTGKRWLKQASSERQWIIRHATRTLVKKGHPEVFQLLGFSNKPSLNKREIILARKTVTPAKELCFTVEISAPKRAKQEQKIVLDYVIYFVKANGELKPKVFKLRNASLRPGENLKIEKRHSFRPISTRRYYPGRHRLALMINGKEVAEADFSYRG